MWAGGGGILCSMPSDKRAIDDNGDVSQRLMMMATGMRMLSADWESVGVSVTSNGYCIVIVIEQ